MTGKIIKKSFLGLQKGRKLKWANMFKMEKGRKLDWAKISAFTVSKEQQ